MMHKNPETSNPLKNPDLFSVSTGKYITHKEVCVCVCVTGTPGKHVFNRRGLAEVFLKVCDLCPELGTAVGRGFSQRLA